MNRVQCLAAALPLLLLGACGQSEASKEKDAATQQLYYQVAAKLRAQDAKILGLEVKIDTLQARLDAQEKTTDEIIGRPRL